MRKHVVAYATSLAIPPVALLAGIEPFYAGASALLSFLSLTVGAKYRWVGLLFYLLSLAAAVYPLVNQELLSLVKW